MTGYLPTRLAAIPIETGKEEEAWASVAVHCEGRLTASGIMTLRSGLDGKVKTILVEPHYICRDYRNLYSHFYSKKFIDRPSYCSRLHFFSCEGLTVNDVMENPKDHQQDYLGFSVIEPVGQCLGRTIIDPAKVGNKDIFCLTTTFSVNINGAQYGVKGFPYRAQSGEATVCAQTALWGCCRYLSQKYTTYGEVLLNDLIEMTGDREGRKTPYHRMSHHDYSSILSQFGCFPAITLSRVSRQPGNDDALSGDWMQDVEAFYDIYSYMESGFPVLTSFGGHVVNVIGHANRKGPATGAPRDSQFHNSFTLLESLVVVDDNFFPYQRLGFKGAPANYGGHYKGKLSPCPCIDSILAAVVPLPEKAFLPPRSARRLSYTLLGTPEFASVLDEMKNRLDNPGEPLVARTFLTNSAAFKKRKLEIAMNSVPADRDALAFHPVNTTLPHFLWITEVAPLSLYNRNRIVGEVVLDASGSYNEHPYIYGRIGKFLWSGGRLTRKDNGALDDYPLFTHNLGER